MPKVFINYRRDDTAGYAGRIHERLASIFGGPSVFMDLDDIQPGADFVRAIEREVVACDVMLVLIGKRWLDSKDTSGSRRIDSPADFVRIEIAKALERNIRVIPVLITNASMPAEKDLPPDLRRLANIQALGLSDQRWDYDISQLVRVLRSESVHAKTQGNRRRFIRTAAWLLALAGVAVVLWLLLARSSPDVSGRWVADVQYDFGEKYSEEFVFRVDAGTLGGTASFLTVDRGIVDGKIEDAQISFMTRTEEVAGDETRQTQHHYNGTVDGDQIRFVMQTEGGFSAHPPVQLVAKRTAPQSEPSSTKGDPPVQSRPWSEAQAVLTLNSGRVVTVRAETLSNCITPNHGLNFTSGQSVEFEKLKSFDVLRANPWQAPNAKADLRIIFLDGDTAEDSVSANCDLFGYNDRGRFSTYFKDLKRVEFQR